MKRVKLSELPTIESVEGMFTIATDKNNRSCKVPLEVLLSEQATNLNAFVSEWADGKRSVIDALAKWDKAADLSDSFDDLAKKILELPVKGDDEHGVIDTTYRGVNTFDLLTELNNHRRQDYPYLWGIQLDGSYTEIELTGADAYYTSDGAFYEADATHTFDPALGGADRYVIYYHAQPRYTVAPTLATIQRLVCLTGQPIFRVTSATASLESYVEPYDMGTNEYTINSGVQQISLGGIRTLPTCSQYDYTCIKYNYPDLREFSGYTFMNRNNRIVIGYLPNLEINNSSQSLFESCSLLHTLYLPKLTEHTRGFLATTLPNLTKVELPQLKTAGGDTIIYGAPKLEKVCFPALEGAYGQRVLWNCQALKEVSLPSLKTLRNAVIIATCNSIESLTLQMSELIGGKIADSCTALKEINLPCMEIIKGGIIAYGCNALEEITFPELQAMYCNAQTLFQNMSGLRRLRFPKLREAHRDSGSYVMFNGAIGNPDTSLVLDFPELVYTRNTTQTNTFIYLGYTTTNFRCREIIINLGAPQDGYIRFTSQSQADIPMTFTVQPGFRSYLNISFFTNQSRESLEAIIDNLGDNTDRPTLQIVLGAANLEKISDEYKQLAISKNYTLS